MSRPEKNRNILHPPLMKGFKPFGIQIDKLETITLTFEEYESLRLSDYEMLSQQEAAVKMNISRPTFTRIHNKAIKNITKAFIEGKIIEISGGSYTLEGEWFRCKKCYKLINGLKNHVRCVNCSAYNNDELINLNDKTPK